MDHCSHAKQAYQAGASAVGGKGWNLSRLSRYGFDVPAGGVLDASVYRALVETPEIAACLAVVREVGGDDLATPRVHDLLKTTRGQVTGLGLPTATRAPASG
ncbi:MAG TPA: hypothetical protein EYQ83_13790, partial [Acidobacteria bacterium]|nr:hypothetical protein [Acidobacteriota bacterium]